MVYYTPNSMPHDFRYVVHNKYLLVLAETGIVGLIGFVWVWLAVGRSLFKLNFSKNPERSTLAIGLTGSLIVLAGHMNFELYAGGNMMLLFWFAVALTAALERLEETDPAVVFAPVNKLPWA
jgi:O-antigen ligase